MKPFEYREEARRGRLERLDYVGAGGREKHAQVYLPFGYDDAPARRYDILYLMHGGGGNPEHWTELCPVQNMLDAAFAAGEAAPMIVVFPTYYAGPPRRDPGTVDPDYERSCVLEFQREELVQYLLPAVEGRYRAFAAGTDIAALKNARNHRAFGGFSMGGVNTWCAFRLHLDCFSVFVPLSGDSWALGPLAGGTRAGETAALLRDSVLEAGFGPGDFAIYAATGTKDMAYASLTPQIEAMKALEDMFRFSEDCDRGNLHYLLGEGLDHCYEAVNQYLYNYLPCLFRG